jgi:phosphatidylglycerophosphate synthase
MELPQDNHPQIKRIGEATHDILTPANVISAAGLVLSLYGATHINEMSGVLQYGAGRVLDLIDGPVARRTYTSRLGAKVDGAFDKAAVVFALAAAAYTDSSPKPVVWAVFSFNSINAAATVYADRQNAEPVTSKAGKYAMFGQNVALGSFLLANAMGGNSALEMTGWAASAATLPVSIKASYNYTRQSLDIRRNTKSYNTRKR